jgi:hypothetical protein
MVAEPALLLSEYKAKERVDDLVHIPLIARPDGEQDRTLQRVGDGRDVQRIPRQPVPDALVGLHDDDSQPPREKP